MRKATQSSDPCDFVSYSVWQNGCTVLHQTASSIQASMAQ